MKFVNEPTAVDVRFAIDGTVRPQHFIWHRKWLDVTDVGRQWIDEAGRHVLVMVAGRRTFELLLERGSLNWHVVQAPDDVVAA